MGRDAFLSKYGFGQAKAFWLIHDGSAMTPRRSRALPLVTSSLSVIPCPRKTSAAGSGGFNLSWRRSGSPSRLMGHPGRSVSGSGISRWPRSPMDAARATQAAACMPALRRLAEGKPRLTSAHEIASELQDLLDAALPEVASPSPWEPIWRLEEQVWEVSDSEGDPRDRVRRGDGPPIGDLRQQGVMCGLTDRVYSVLQESPDWIVRIQNEIVERYLADVPDQVISSVLGRVPVVNRVWWVNQGKTYNQERDGGYLWAPTVTKTGRPVAHHTAVSHLRPSDVVIHYSGGSIRALGHITTSPQTCPRPVELPDAPWAAEGHRAGVRYFELEVPIPLEELVDRPRGYGPSRSRAVSTRAISTRCPAAGLRSSEVRSLGAGPLARPGPRRGTGSSKRIPRGGPSGRRSIHGDQVRSSHGRSLSTRMTCTMTMTC